MQNKKKTPKGASPKKPVWVVCIKQVPREPVFKKKGNSFHMAREATEGILNPHDRFALDFALECKAAGGGKIVVMTMGPPQAEEALREALAFGADQAILLSDPAFAGADTLATACTLAAAIRKIKNYRLILCGAKTMDSDTGQVGPQIAEFLDLPMAAYVDALTCKPEASGTLRVERTLDGFREKLLLELPALITIAGRRKKDKSPLSLRSVEEAFSDPSITHWTLKDLDLSPGRVGEKGSATEAKEYAYLKRSRSGEIFQGKPSEAADKIIAALIEHNSLGG